MYKKNDILELLNSEKICYEITNHKAVFTIEEMLQENLPHPDLVAKNLFIRDDKKRNYYLLSAKEDRHINLKDFQVDFGTRRLSFASENDLYNILNLTKGSVSPFGLLNDSDKRVHFFLDKFYINNIIGIHPNDNTATVWIKTSDLLVLFKKIGIAVTLF